jgi:hypothetical protein
MNRRLCIALIRTAVVGSGGAILLLVSACRDSRHEHHEVLDATTAAPLPDSGTSLDAGLGMAPAEDSGIDSASGNPDASAKPADVVICDGSEQPRFAEITTPGIKLFVEFDFSTGSLCFMSPGDATHSSRAIRRRV